jgi:hypothetical protein
MAQQIPQPISDSSALWSHSCVACSKLRIKNDLPNNTIAEFHYAEVAKYASSGCILFQAQKRKFDNSVVPWYRDSQKLLVRMHIDSDDNTLTAVTLEWWSPSNSWQEIGNSLEPFVERSTNQALLLPQENASHSDSIIDNPSPVFIHSSPFNLYPGSASSSAWVKQYLNRCRSNHSKCNRLLKNHRGTHIMPRRLLDVGQIDQPIVRLSKTDPSNITIYAISSYAWGSGSKAKSIERVKTIKENFGPRMTYGIQVDSLPRTIRDLIEVTRSIAYQYLWIDALCIVQDDPDDSKDQLDNMAGFYKQADVLISAARASHCDEGFLQTRNADQCYGTIYKLPFEWLSSNGDIKGSVCLSAKSLAYASDDSPLHTRIWTFQEHLVSTRVISFGTRQTRWTCPTYGNVVDGGDSSVWVDDLEYTLEEAFSPSKCSSESKDHTMINLRVQAWMKIVEKYSSRQYSRLQDRLPAFFESISFLAPFAGWSTAECVGGIWKADAARQLLWRKPKPLTAREIGAEKDPNETVPGPSWSWATLPGEIIYHTWEEFRALNSSKTVEFVGETGKPVRLIIKSQIQEASWMEDSFQVAMSQGPFTSFQNILYVEVAWDMEMSAEKVWLLNLAPKNERCMEIGLVLVRVGESQDHFARRGVFRAIRSGSSRLNDRLLVKNCLYSDEPARVRQVSLV